MSAFLGPIHVKMYNRILHQDSMTQALGSVAAEQGWARDADVDAKAPAASHAPLETIIDANNIHGWLNDAVARCEKRFALTVCGIVEHHPERMEALKAAMKKLGKACNLPAFARADEAFEAVHDILLDGMPCDFPFVTTQVNGDTVEWNVENCPHKPYWGSGTCDGELYYQLRDAWMDGALEHSGILHSRPAPYSHILRKAS